MSVISLVEMIYLAGRGRLDSAATTHVLNLLATSNESYFLVEIDLDTVRSLRLVPRAAVPDMPDRIITATALSLILPLITVDERIHASGVVPIVWWAPPVMSTSTSLSHSPRKRTQPSCGRTMFARRLPAVQDSAPRRSARAK